MLFSIILPYSEALHALPGGSITAFFVLLVALAAGFQIILMLALKILRILVGKTETTLDDRILAVLSKYLPTIATVTALWTALESTYPDLIVYGAYKEFDIYIVVMLGIAGFLISSIADALLVWYGLEIRQDRRNKKTEDKEVFPFVRNVIKIAILLIFAVFILQKLGFETGAIITGLGVGGLAVALALQDTLGNFFGGVHILIDKPFREEDYIRLENGLEGTVKQIGWRTTRILTPTQNEIIVPNSKLAGSALENYSTPKELTGVTYTIGVDYKEDIDNVEKIITDVLHEVAKSSSTTMDETSIWVRFDSFGDYSLNFKFGYLVRGYVNRFQALKEVNRALFYAFKEKNVNIPFPVRVVHTQNSPAANTSHLQGDSDITKARNGIAGEPETEETANVRSKKAR